MPLAVTLSFTPICAVRLPSNVTLYPAGRFDPLVVVVTVSAPVPVSGGGGGGGGAVQLTAKVACVFPPAATVTVTGLAPLTLHWAVRPVSPTACVPATTPRKVRVALTPMAWCRLSTEIE